MPGIANRVEELKNLTKFFNKDGFGFIVVSGKEGTGKTTILREFFRDRKCMWHTCSPDKSEMGTIINLIKSVGLSEKEFLGYGEVMAVYGIHRNTGILIDEVAKKSSLDGDIFAGMLSAVQAFVCDSLSMLSEESEGYLSSLEYGEYRIIVARGKYVDIIAIVRGIESYSLKQELIRTVEEFEETYSNMLENWDGNVSKFNLRDMVRKYVESDEWKDISYDTMMSVFLSLLRDYPVVIDDAHWIDRKSLDFLRIVVKRAIAENVGKFVLSINTKFLNEDIMQFISEVATHQMEVKDFTLEQVEEFVQFYYSDNMFPQEFFEKLYRCTGGNPLTMLNTLKNLETTGGIVNEEGFWRYRFFKCPEKKIILAPLDEMSRETLKLSAIIGFIRPDILTEILGIKRFEALHILNKLSRAGLLERRSNIYTFTHDGIRREVIDNIDEYEIKEYATASAEYFESKGEQENGARVWELVDRNRAAKIYRILAEESEQKGEHLKAANYHLRVGKLTGSEESYIRAAHILRSMGNYSKALKIYDSFKNNPEALEGYVVCHAYLGEVVEIDDAPLKNLALAIVSYRKGKFREALEFAKKVVKERDIFDAYLIIAEAYHFLGSVDNSLKYFKKARELAQNDIQKVVMLRKELSLLLESGKSDEVLARIDDVINLARKIGSWREMAALLNLQANALSAVKHEDILKAYFKALRYAEMQDDYNLTAIILGNIAMKFIEMGKYEKALKYQQKVLKIFQAYGNEHGVAFTKLDIGQSYIFQGKLIEGKRYLQEALDELKRIGDVSTQLYTQYFLLLAEFIETRDCSFSPKMLEIYGKFKDFEDIYSQLNIAESLAFVEKICDLGDKVRKDLFMHKDIIPIDLNSLRSALEGEGAYNENNYIFRVLAKWCLEKKERKRKRKIYNLKRNTHDRDGI